MSRKTGVILSYVLRIFDALSVLLLTPFIIRTLGQAEYGVYKLVFALNNYLLLLDLGVGNATIRYIAKYKAEQNLDKERKFLAVATVFYSAVAFLALIIGCVLVFLFPYIFAKGLSQEEVYLGQILLGLSILNSSITLGTSEFGNILIAYEKYAVSRVASMIQTVSRIVLTYAALVLGWGSIGIVVVNLLTTALCRVFFVIYVLGVIKLKPLFHGIEFSFIKDIVAYSSLILLQMIATQLNSSVDQLLIGSLVEASAIILAVYGVGTQVVQYFQSFGAAFTDVLMPGVVKLVEGKASPAQLTDEMVKVGRIVFMVLSLIWCGFLVNGREFITLWAGTENAQAYSVAAILMTAQLFILTESIGTQILWALNQHREQTILKTVIVLSNIVLTILLIQWKPLLGATIGTFLSLMLGDVLVMNLIFRKKLSIHLAEYYKRLFQGIIPCLIPALVVGLLVRRFIPVGWMWLCLKILIMVSVYGAAMLWFGMTQYEKELFYSIILKWKLHKKDKSL